MAKYEFSGYAADALVYDAGSNTFSLATDFNAGTDIHKFEVSDNDNSFDGDDSSRWDERGDDRDQNGEVFDSDGNSITNGKIYIEQVDIVEAPDGTRINIDRIEIDGELVGYFPSQPLEQGVDYTLVGSGDVPQTYDYYESNGIPCFGPGTLIMTDSGENPVEWLEAGDKVLTRDHGYQPVRWIGRIKLPSRHFKTYPSDQPVTIPAGTLGNGLPTHDLCVTGDHRLLICDPRAHLLFDTPEVLAPAKAWLDAGLGLGTAPVSEYSLSHVLCDEHEVIMAHGAWVESFFPGPEALRRLTAGHRAEVTRILGAKMESLKTARHCLTRTEVACLLPQKRAGAAGPSVLARAG